MKLMSWLAACMTMSSIFGNASKEELELLLSHYSQGIPLRMKGSGNIIYGIDTVKLTFGVLRHFFNPMQNQFERHSLAGLHYLSAEIKPAIWAHTDFANGTLQTGYMALQINDEPMLKTVFTDLLPKNLILSYLAEAAGNIHSVKKQDDGRISVIGRTRNNIAIKFLINPETQHIVTFYPLADISRPENNSLRAAAQSQRDAIKAKSAQSCPKRPRESSGSNDEGQGDAPSKARYNPQLGRASRWDVTPEDRTK